MTKSRAPRNRTLTLTSEEYAHYRRELYMPNGDTSLAAEDITGQVICADLLRVLPYLPAAFADLIIIDPPYNCTKDYHGLTFRKQSPADYAAYLRSWFPAVVSLLKPNGTLYLCGDWRCTAALQTVMTEHLTVINRITWQREKGRGALRNWKNGMEDIWFGVKNPKNYFFDIDAVKVRRRVMAPYRVDGEPKDWEETPNGNYRMTYPSNFWDDVSVPYWSMPENTDHPTQKPEKLLAKLILASCPAGGVVFDPFLGSGTTAVVAKKLGRRYSGVEINPEYACWALKRLHMAEADKKIQGYTDGVFWERNTLPHSKDCL